MYHTPDTPVPPKEKEKTGDFFRKITQFTGAFLEAAYINLFSILLLAIIFYFYWEFDQGKDLLLTLNQQSDWQIGFFFLTLLTLAAICWYIPRMCYTDNSKAVAEKNKEKGGEARPSAPSAPVRARGFESLVEESAVSESALANEAVSSRNFQESEETAPKRASILPDVFFEDIAQHTVENYYEEKGYMPKADVEPEVEDALPTPSPGFEGGEVVEEDNARGFDVHEEAEQKEKDKKRKKIPTTDLIPESETWEDRRERYRILFKENLPRLLGSMVLFIVAFGMLNILQEFLQFARIPAFVWLILIFFAMSYLGYRFNSAYFKARQMSDPFFLRKVYRIALILGTVVLATLLYLMLENKGDLSELSSLFLATTLVGVSFFFITVVRKPLAKYIYAKYGNRIDSLGFLPLNWVLVILTFATLGLIIFYLILNFWPSFSQAFNPLICANLAFIFYIGILYYLRVRGARMSIDFVSIFLFICLLLYIFNSKDKLHRITMVEDSREVGSRPSLPQYFDDWLSERESYIHSVLDTSHEARYPVFIISSEGGGSRAAYWTVLSHQSMQEANAEYFDKHLFAMTGASGGNTGNSSYFTMRRSQLPVDSIQSAAGNMFRENFLSSSITQFLGIDIWKNMFRLGGRDRAKSLEKEWTDKLAEVSGDYGQAIRDSWDNSFLSLWYEPSSENLIAYKPLPPLLFINATHVQRGGHGIFSPVKLSPTYYKGKDLLATIAATERHQGKSVPLKTANLLNASFPYVNPAGVIQDVGNFVDAGYYDNFGAQTAISILEELKAHRTEAPDFALIKRINFVSVLIRNSTVDGDSEAYSDPEYLQLRAPLKTLGGIRSAVNSHNRWELAQVADTSFEINLLPRTEITLTKGKDTIQPAVPLARYLSDLAIEAMDQSMVQLKTYNPIEKFRSVGYTPPTEYGRPPLEIERRRDLQKAQELLRGAAK